ncbi:unnamed protein product, partial [Sphacelaria rigidula]
CYRLNHDAAAKLWKSRVLPAALAQWVVVSLGDGESRRRRQTWRHALLQSSLYTSTHVLGGEALVEVDAEEEKYRLDEFLTSERGGCCTEAPCSPRDGGEHGLGGDCIPPPQVATVRADAFSAASANATKRNLECDASGGSHEEEGNTASGMNTAGLGRYKSTEIDLVPESSALPCKYVHRESAGGVVVVCKPAVWTEEAAVRGWGESEMEDGNGKSTFTEAVDARPGDDPAPDFNASRCASGPSGAEPEKGERWRREGNCNVSKTQPIPVVPSQDASVAGSGHAVPEPTDGGPNPWWSSHVQDSSTSGENSCRNRNVVWREQDNDGNMFLPKQAPSLESPQARRLTEKNPGVVRRIPLALQECASDSQLVVESAAAAAVERGVSPGPGDVKGRIEDSSEHFDGSYTQYHRNEGNSNGRDEHGSTYHGITETFGGFGVECQKKENNTAHGRGGASDRFGDNCERLYQPTRTTLSKRTPPSVTHTDGAETCSVLVA